MADNYEYDIEDDEDDFNDTGLVKKLRKQIDGLQKQLKERESLIEEFTTYSHEASVGEILESFGLNAKIAQFIPSEVEADPDAVAEWLNEYGDAFGIEAVEEGGEASPDAQAYERMSSLDDGEIDPYVGNDLQTRIDNVTSKEELLKIIQG